MKTVKSLLLGSATGVVALAGAQAADLPYAEPVEYVKVCSTYGEGFFYIPGTDTCLQISGKVRVETYVSFNDDDGGVSPVGDPEDNDFATRARGVIAADARTETEWGTLRSYVEFEGNSDTDNLAGGSPFGNIEVVAAFVQFAGITAGRTKSFFDYKPNKSFIDFVSAEDVWTLAYTAAFGQGISATIGVEDKTYRMKIDAEENDDGDIEGDYLDQTWPNVVANLRISQSWGVVQLSAAVQDNEGDREDYASPIAVADEIGWAVQGIAKFNLPTANKGSYLWVAAAYADGAISYAGAEERLGFGYSGAGGWSGRYDQSLLNGELANNTLLNVGGGIGFQASETIHLAAGATYIEFENAAGATLEMIQAEASVWWTPIDNLTIAGALQYGQAEGDNPPWRADESDDIRFVGRIERSF